MSKLLEINCCVECKNHTTSCIGMEEFFICFLLGEKISDDKFNVEVLPQCPLPDARESTTTGTRPVVFSHRTS